jgi:ribosomal protein S4E
LPSDDAALTSFNIAGITLPTPDAYNNYRIDVANTVESYDVTAILHEPNATMRINNVVIASGATTTIPLHLGENVNNILVTAQDGTTFSYTGVIITRAYKSDNLLSSLTVSTGTLSPAFSSAVTDYVLEVSNATTTVDMTPVYDETASADEDGFPAPSGLAFTTVPLSIGYTEIPIRVRAQDGTAKTYRVNIHRAISTDATLADLGIITTISGLNVPFDANTDTYNTTVTSDVTKFRVKPVANNDGSSITVNGVALNPVNGNSYTMKYFSNAEPVLIEVTAGDGVTKKTYTINVTRNFSTNNFLSTFGVSGYPVTPDFDPAVNNYTINISDPNIVSLSMIPLAQDPLAELRVNGVTVNRGNSPYVPIHGGVNTVAVKVTAFGAGENIYTLTVNRAYSARRVNCKPGWQWIQSCF